MYSLLRWFDLYFFDFLGGRFISFYLSHRISTIHESHQSDCRKIRIPNYNHKNHMVELFLNIVNKKFKDSCVFRDSLNLQQKAPFSLLMQNNLLFLIHWFERFLVSDEYFFQSHYPIHCFSSGHH